MTETALAYTATKPESFPALLERMRPQLAKALPRHLSADRMTRIALTAFRRNPALGKCNPLSVLAAVVQASQLGLEPDTLGRAYLIPYGSECQFIPGWKGLVDLVSRAGMATVWTGVIYQGQAHTYQQGDSPQLIITDDPPDDADESTITHAWAVGRVKGAEYPIIERWSVERIRKHRDRYNKIGKKHYSYENLEMYCRKVVLLQVLKYMPMSAELTRAIEMNDAAEIGEQRIDLADVGIVLEPESAPNPLAALRDMAPVDRKTGEISIADPSNTDIIERYRAQIARATTEAELRGKLLGLPSEILVKLQPDIQEVRARIATASNKEQKDVQ